MILRSYQRALIAEARELMRTLPPGGRRLIVQAATGSGKTAIACEIVRLSMGLSRRVLYTVPRAEILQQTSAKLLDCGLAHVLLQGGRRADVGAAGVILAMSHTMDRRLPIWGDWSPDLIVVDEAHANTGQAARLAATWPRAAMLGLTATPDRLSDADLARVYSQIVQGPSVRELVRHGWLVPTRVLAAHQADLSGVAVRAGDYDPRGLALSFSSSALLGNCVDAWIQHSRGRRTILFAATVSHSRALVERYLAAGIRAVHLDGDTPDEDRARTLDQLRRGEVEIVCNVGLFVEGLDLVEVETIQLATATQSLARYLQMVGRGMRPSPRTAKTDLLLIDHGGNVARHGRPDQDRTWTLRDTPPPRGGPGEAPTRSCHRCQARFPIRAQACPACGAPVPLPRELQVTLREVPDAATPRPVQQTPAQRRPAASAAPALPPSPLDRVQVSKRTAPRPAPPEFRGVWQVWVEAEQQRAALGLPLPTASAPGYSERVCLRALGLL